MTLNTGYKPNVFVGNGVIKEFAYDFNPISIKYLKVYFEENGEWVEQNSGWVADDAVSAYGGTITFDKAPTSRVQIARVITQEQPTSFKTSSGFDAKVVETSFDKLTGMVQQLQDASDRSVRVEVGDDQSPEELIQDVFDKLDLSNVIIEQANKATEEAVKSVEEAKSLLNETSDFVSQKKEEIDTTATDATNAIVDTKESATKEINTAIDDAIMNISDIVSQGQDTISKTVSDAEGAVTEIALNAANKAIEDASEQVTQKASESVDSYIDENIKPDLTSYVDSAKSYSESALSYSNLSSAKAGEAGTYANEALGYRNSAEEFSEKISEANDSFEQLLKQINGEGELDSIVSGNNVTQATTSTRGTARFATDAEAGLGTSTDTMITPKQLQLYSGNGSGYIGQITFGIRTDTPEGQLRLDGSEYPVSAFKDFVENYLQTGKIPSQSMESYEQAYKSEGNVGVFGYDLGGETFRVPCLQDSVYIAAAITAGDIGTFVNESLPNIKGQLSLAPNAGIRNDSAVSGAFSRTSTTGYSPTLNSNTGGAIVDFDASKSSSTYQDGAKVQGDHIIYPLFITVANKAVAATESQYNAFIDGLNNTVKIAGTQTITGNKLFSNDGTDDTTVGAGSGSQITAQATNLDINNLPSSGAVYGGITLTDVNNIRVGKVETKIQSDGIMGCVLSSSKYADSAYTYAAIGTFINSSNKVLYRLGQGHANATHSYMKIPLNDYGLYLLICTGYISSGSATFPLAFTSTPRCAVSLISTAAAGYVTYIGARSTTSISLKRNSVSDSNVTGDYIAIGFRQE